MVGRISTVAIHSDRSGFFLRRLNMGGEVCCATSTILSLSPMPRSVKERVLEGGRVPAGGGLVNVSVQQ